MKRFGLLIALFAGLIFILPSLTAQDAKKDLDKADKKDVEKKDDKKDPEKKDEKKDPEKKDDEKKKPDLPVKKLTEKMPAHGEVFRSKIISANGATNREFTVEIQEIDPKKVADLNTWKFQQSQSLAQQQFNALKADFKQRPQQLANYQKALATYNYELAKRSGNIYSAKPLEVRAHDDAKVRTTFLPVMFDDEGRQKKWTEKEKKEFRGDTMLPGYPSDFDAIKSGQFVEVYMHKKPAAPKDAPKKKKDDEPAPAMTPEFIVIVILAEGK